MNKLALLVLALSFHAAISNAQAPSRFNYQGIARNASGTPLANKPLSLRISVHDGVATGTIVYQETQSITTNAYGLYNIAIGGGTVVTGSLASVAWGTGNKFIQVELDPAGGTAYVDLGASQLLSVPYALHAASSASSTAPTLTLTGNVLSAGGNSVTLPSYTAGTGISISGGAISVNNLSGDVTGAPNATTVTKLQNIGISTTTPASGQVLKYNGATWAPAADNDAQTLSISGGTLSVSGGNSVTLPSGAAYTAGNGISISGTNVISTSNLAGDVTGATNANTVTKIQGIAVSSSTPSSGQVLVYNGTSWIFGNPASSVSLSGTTNYVTKFTSGSTVGNSLLQDDGTSVSIGAAPTSSYRFQVNSGSTSSILGTTSGSGGAITGTVSGTGTGSAGYFDGGTNGKGLMVPNGAAVFGAIPGSEANRISVVQSGSGLGMDSNAAIYGYVNSVTSALKGGIYGTYDTTLFGVGVQGLGWHGVPYKKVTSAFSTFNPSVNDIGVYGSANSTGVMGVSVVGYGVAGYSGSSNSTSAGVYGYNNNSSGGIGVTGNSTNGIGVYGTAGTSSGVGTYGTVAGTNALGVYGTSSGSNGIGVRGDASSTNGGYGIYGYSLSSSGYAGYFSGKVSVTGTLSKGAGSFKIDDPIDPENKYLYHSFVESPDMMNIYNGNVVTDGKGFATITLPPYFEALNKDFRYQLTVVGTFAQAIIKEKVKDNHFVIQTNQPNVEVSWQVTGIRQDGFANAHRIPEEIEKELEYKGLYLHPTELGKPVEQGIDYKIQKEYKAPSIHTADAQPRKR
jgi:hypothetical protein